MSGHDYTFAEAVIPPIGFDAGADASPRALDLLDALLAGDCRRCDRPVDRHEPDPSLVTEDGNLRIPFAIIRSADGRQDSAPICDGCADYLRGHSSR